MAIAGFVLRRRDRLFNSKLFQRFVLVMGPSGFISLLAGWITTEAGRQPWVVYGVMRTSQALSPITAQQVGVSLFAFVVVYSLVFGTGIYYMIKLACTGPALTPEAGGSGASISLQRSRHATATPVRETAKITIDRH
jgi:cytochrome bd ubiquinol oxidase subunit I